MSLTRRETLALTLAFPLLAQETAEAAPKPPDLRAPVSAPNLHIAVQKDGVQAKGFRYTPLEPKRTPWRAKWISLPEQKPSASVILFRREFDLVTRPVSAIASLSADISYRLWVNGHLAARGPADIGMDYHRVPTGKWFYDLCDLTHLLRQGKNVFAVEVFAQPLIGWEGSRQPGHFLCELEDGETTLLQTDNQWQTIASTHWQNRNGRWHYDGTQEPTGWRIAGFQANGWQNAVAVQDVWQPLVPSEIPARMEALYPHTELKRITPNVKTKRNNFPVTLETDGGLTVRYDRVLPAFVGLTVQGGRGGTLHIEPNEPDAPGFHRAAAIVLSGTEQQIELPFLDSFSVINLRATGLQEPLTIKDVRAVFASQPVAYRGSFACSDPEFTRLWSVCRWATQICLQTHHLDSPHHQEPISDPGDYMILSLINYAAFFQPALTRQDLRKYAWIMGQCKNQVFHTSYALLWLQMLRDYYDHTGDTALVRELAPAVHSLLDTFAGYRGKNGLLSEAPNYMFMDWVDIEGFPGHHPPAVIGQGYLTAFYYRALDDARCVAELTSDAVREAAYSRLRTEIADAFQREFWVEAKGLYRDGKPFQSSVKPGQWLPADKEIETFTAHVNILAVLYDLAPKDQQAEILERAMNSKNFTCQPYFMHFVFEALAHCGLFERLGLAQMKRWKINEATQSLREMWTTGDLSHGWGATPLRQLSTRVLGVQVRGANQIVFAPKPCGLDWARGSVPLASGDVKVDWRRQGEQWHLVVDVPENCSAEIVLPQLHKTVGAGRHRFQTPYPAKFSEER